MAKPHSLPSSAQLFTAAVPATLSYAAGPPALVAAVASARLPPLAAQAVLQYSFLDSRKMAANLLLNVLNDVVTKGC